MDLYDFCDPIGPFGEGCQLLDGLLLLVLLSSAEEQITHRGDQMASERHLIFVTRVHQVADTQAGEKQNRSRLPC